MHIKSTKTMINITDVKDGQFGWLDKFEGLVKYDWGWQAPKNKANYQYALELVQNYDRKLRQARDDEEKRKRELKKNKNNEQLANRDRVLITNKNLYDFVRTLVAKILSKEEIDYQGTCSVLMNHQKAGCLISRYFKRYAYFYDTGTGKTVMALEIMNDKYLQEGKRFLVICPKTIINSAWMNDCANFFPQMRLLPLRDDLSFEEYADLYKHWNLQNSRDEGISPRYYRGTLTERKNKFKNVLMWNAHHCIINAEAFRNDPQKYLTYVVNGELKKFDGLIFDESAILRNPDSSITRCVQDAALSMEYVYLLSGKPAPNRVIEYYPQMKLIIPELFVEPYEAWAKVVLTESVSFHNNPNGDYLVKHGLGKREFLELVSKGSITVSKEDCIDLPPKTYQIHAVELNPAAMSQYLTMRDQLYIDLRDNTSDKIRSNKNLYAKHILMKIAKLRQIASGFVIDEENRTHNIHAHKVSELLNILVELDGKQALIWCQYVYEIENLQKLLEHQGKHVVTAYGKTKNKDDSIRMFKSGEADYLIAHPRTLRYGVTLTNCTYAIYYSTSYSYEEYYQSHDRIYRKGQTRACTFLFIQTKDTVDELMYQALIYKKSETELAEAILKHLEEKTKT